MKMGGQSSKPYTATLSEIEWNPSLTALGKGCDQATGALFPSPFKSVQLQDAKPTAPEIEYLVRQHSCTETTLRDFGVDASIAVQSSLGGVDASMSAKLSEKVTTSMSVRTLYVVIRARYNSPTSVRSQHLWSKDCLGVDTMAMKERDFILKHGDTFVCDRLGGAFMILLFQFEAIEKEHDSAVEAALEMAAKTLTVNISAKAEAKSHLTDAAERSRTSVQGYIGGMDSEMTVPKDIEGALEAAATFHQHITSETSLPMRATLMPYSVLPGYGKRCKFADTPDGISYSFKKEKWRLYEERFIEISNIHATLDKAFVNPEAYSRPDTEGRETARELTRWLTERWLPTKTKLEGYLEDAVQYFGGDKQDAEKDDVIIPRVFDLHIARGDLPVYHGAQGMPTARRGSVEAMGYPGHRIDFGVTLPRVPRVYLHMDDQHYPLWGMYGLDISREKVSISMIDHSCTGVQWLIEY